MTFVCRIRGGEPDGSPPRTLVPLCYWTAYMIGYGNDPYADQLKIGPTFDPARR